MDDGFIVISLKQSMEWEAEQLLHSALDSYRATLAAVGDAAAQACPPAGETLQQKLLELSTRLTDSASATQVAETERAVEDELKTWGERASGHFQKNTSDIQEVLIMAGRAAQQVGERDQRYTKRFTEFTERLHATAKLGDLPTIRQSLGQHTADLKSYVAQMVKDSEGIITQLRAQISVYESRLEEMEQVASQDPLTGLANRRKVERQMEHRMRAAQTFSVISLDLNDFKSVNDTFGHLAGDHLLRQFATELRTVFRASDVVGRWGGDEFIVLVDGDLTEANARLERIHRWVDGSYTLKGGADSPKVKVHAAAGAAQWQPGETAGDLLNRADAAMYASKPTASAARRAS